MYINKAKKIVLKIGSSNLVDNKGKLKEKWLKSLVEDIEKLKNFKKKIKKSFEITSLISNQNFEKVKKTIYKKCT